MSNSLCVCQNVETTQAQYDLLQSFTAAVAQIPAEGAEPAAVTVATGGVTPCAYCSKSFKTSGGLNRHLAQVRRERERKSTEETLRMDTQF